MFAFDSFNPKKSLPFLIALLLVAQVDLACAFGWPQTLLLVVFQLARIYAKRAMQSGNEPAHD